MMSAKVSAKAADSNKLTLSATAADTCGQPPKTPAFMRVLLSATPADTFFRSLSACPRAYISADTTDTSIRATRKEETKWSI